MSRSSACLVATCLLLQSGCALFVSDKAGSTKFTSPFSWSKGKSEHSQSDSPILKVARLEASIVSRPANDAKIRRYVWEELDESGLMAPDDRQRLNSSGFRVGVAGSATPWALQSLAREAVLAHHPNEEQQLAGVSQMDSVGPSFSLMTSGKSLLEVQSHLDTDTLPLQQIDAMRALRDRNDLRCVFEVTVKELRDDWVLLNVLPQIHAGSNTTRLSINGTSEQLPVRQNILPLYEQQFTVKLLTGEVAVIGRFESAEWNLGRLFFQPDSGSSGTERLLMIRMAGIDKLKGQSDPSFRLGSLSQ